TVRAKAPEVTLRTSAPPPEGPSTATAPLSVEVDPTAAAPTVVSPAPGARRTGTTLLVVGGVALVLLLGLGLGGLALVKRRTETVAPLSPTLPPTTVAAAVPTAAATVAPPPAVPGAVRVESQPAGATVTVDNQPRGGTPLEVPDLALGHDEVKGELRGYRAATERGARSRGREQGVCRERSGRAAEEALAHVGLVSQRTRAAAQGGRLGLGDVELRRQRDGADRRPEGHGIGRQDRRRRGALGAEGLEIRAGKQAGDEREGPSRAEVHVQGRLGIAKMAKLIVNPTSSSRREIHLSRTLVSIGRDPSNDLVLPDAMVSRRHAVIEYRGSQYYLRDCNSSNGSLVNGDRVSERNLRDGDLVAIGTARLLFRDDLHE